MNEDQILSAAKAFREAQAKMDEAEALLDAASRTVAEAEVFCEQAQADFTRTRRALIEACGGKMSPWSPAPLLNPSVE
jgi:hypothetical protein